MKNKINLASGKEVFLHVMSVVKLKVVENDKGYCTKITVTLKVCQQCFEQANNADGLVNFKNTKKRVMVRDVILPLHNILIISHRKFTVQF